MNLESFFEVCGCPLYRKVIINTYIEIDKDDIVDDTILP